MSAWKHSGQTADKPGHLSELASRRSAWSRQAAYPLLAPFLSTIILASAGLVAITDSGLLVARFVGLDSDERSNRRVLGDAAGRLASARRRAKDARDNQRTWEAWNFLDIPDILDAIGHGVSELDELRQYAWCPLSDQGLQPYVSKVADEFTRAHGALDDRVSASDGDWRAFRKAAPDLPEIRIPSVWQQVYEEIAARLADEERARSQARQPIPTTWATGLPMPEIPPITMNPDLTRNLGRIAIGRVQIDARRQDDLRAAVDRAQQRVEDYEDELRRLTEAHKEIVRPDARLWWGVVILIAFAIVGVALPVWKMSQGPADLGAVRWLVYPFGGALAVLLVYVVVYLAQLSRRKPPPIGTGGDEGAARPGA